ncbi:hypothetical protein Q7C36_017757 [Tachysurus vachellii]|uniref:Myb/SANT-like DNA-binding domain-containing protein n=1 Tax=Tachysurus vachellii TaxID=175792 RepID=A0AA88M3A2_TACVA|nr:uncharacterized protein si:dkey-66i24.7 [Tachysurus vachellii]KAK2829767.1 hypothetical protein Q7C36_017757 [Tachysurus vachellii]
MEVTESIVTNSTLLTADTEKSKTEFVWTLQATWHLVRVRLDMEAEFDQPVCKKKRLWEGVAEQVTARLRAEGYADVPVRAFECDLKWRNMLATYRKNAERAKRLGVHAVHWEFFRAMDQVLGRSYEELEAQRKAKLSNTKLGKAMASKHYTPILPSPTITTLPGPTPSRPPQDVLQLYLELQERKLNMWAQQKVLEERKIDAINNLARAISSLAQDAVTTPKDTVISQSLASLSSQH